MKRFIVLLFFILFIGIIQAETPTLTIGILSWKDPKTLEKTLRSYKKNGLLEYADEKLVFFNEISHQDRDIAQRYGFKILGSKKNLGIAKGFLSLIQAASSDCILLLEDDWLLIEDIDGVQIQLDEIKQLLLAEKVHCVRLRHRKKPGKPLYSQWLKGQEHKGFTHLLNCIHWHKFPEKIFPQYITKMDTNSPLYLTSSKYGNYTNNPCIYALEWYKRTVVPIMEEIMNNSNLEDVLTDWWSKQYFKVVQGRGLFMHGRPVHNWNR